jgi:hypothetical protein
MDPLELLIAAVTAAHRATLEALITLAEGIDTIDADTPIPYALADADAAAEPPTSLEV